MKIEGKKVSFDSKHERELYDDLVAYLCDSQKGKRELKRIVKAISWYMNEREPDFWKGYIFDCQGTISGWGIFEGGKDQEKDDLYTDFMQHHCSQLMKEKKADSSIVSLALVKAYNDFVKKAGEAGLIQPA